MDAGALLRARRVAHGISQAELARRAGTRQATISRLENGHESPTIDRLDQLLVALGERLELTAVPIDPERSDQQRRADLAASAGARLEDGFALSTFASQLAGRACR